jgi:hypothetical protein
MLSCKEVTQLVSESLVMCKFCSRYRKQLFILRDAIRLHCEHDKEMDAHGSCLSPEAKERIGKSLNLESDESK